MSGVALLMVSTIPTFSIKRIRIPPHLVMPTLLGIGVFLTAVFHQIAVGDLKDGLPNIDSSLLVLMGISQDFPMGGSGLSYTTGSTEFGAVWDYDTHGDQSNSMETGDRCKPRVETTACPTRVP